MRSCDSRVLGRPLIVLGAGLLGEVGWALHSVINEVQYGSRCWEAILELRRGVSLYVPRVVVSFGRAVRFLVLVPIQSRIPCRGVYVIPTYRQGWHGLLCRRITNELLLRRCSSRRLRSGVIPCPPCVL